MRNQPTPAKDNTVFTFRPKKLWDTSSQYAVRISTGVKEANGEAISAQWDSTFTTNDVKAVTSVSPMDKSNEIARDTKLSVTFDHAVAPNSITVNTSGTSCNDGYTFQVSKDNSNNCVQMDGNFGIKFADGNTGFTVKPQELLDTDSSYSVRLNKAFKNEDSFKDENGSVSYSFETVKRPTVSAWVVSDSTSDPTADVMLQPAIEVRFSKTMDPASITANSSGKSCSGAIQLSSDSGFADDSCIPMKKNQATSSAKNTIFTISPAENLKPGQQYYARVTEDAKSKGSLALSVDHKSANTFITRVRLSGDWKFVDGNDTDGISASDQVAISPTLVVHDSKLYAIWEETPKVSKMYGNEEMWIWPKVPENAEHTIKGKLWDGNNWNDLALSLSNGAKRSHFPTGISFNSGLFLAWSKTNPQLDNVPMIAKNDGTWAQYQLKKQNDTSKGWKYLNLVDCNNKLYLGWTDVQKSVDNLLLVEFTNRVAEVVKKDGDSYFLDFIDQTGDASPNRGSHSPFRHTHKVKLACHNSELYAAWVEKKEGSNQNPIRVSRWNGTDWAFIDGGINKDITFYRRGIGNVDIVESENGLFVAWSENFFEVKEGKPLTRRLLHVMKYDKKGNWELIDGGDFGINYDPSKNANDPKLLVYKGNLIVGWAENDPSRTEIDHQLRVKQWNTNGWISFDEKLNFNNKSPADSLDLMEFNGKVYAAWSERGDAANGDKWQIRVAEASLH